MKSIGLEPSSKSGIPIFMSLKSLLKSVPNGIKDNCLLLGKMNCKMQDTRLMILNLKKVKMPVCLTGTDIACIQIDLNLILSSAKGHSGTIMSLVHILVDVLACFN